jgi:hypothetical protein
MNTPLTTPPKPALPLTARFTPRVGMIAAGVAGVAVIGCLVLGVSLGVASAQASADAKTHEAQLSAISDDRDKAEHARDYAEATYRPAYDALVSIESRETAVSNGEAALKKDRDALTKAQETLAADQAKLADAKEALGSESWIKEVRTCLARGGSYVSASVTNSSFLGLDVSCYNG